MNNSDSAIPSGAIGLFSLGNRLHFPLLFPAKNFSHSGVIHSEMGMFFGGPALRSLANPGETRGVRARHTQGIRNFPALRFGHEPTPNARCRLLFVIKK